MCAALVYAVLGMAPSAVGATHGPGPASASGLLPAPALSPAQTQVDGSRTLGEAKLLTLEQAVRRALEVSPTVKQATLAVRLAELRVRDAEVRVSSTATPLELADARQALQDACQRVRLEKVEAALEAERRYYAVLRDAETLALRQHASERASRRLDIVRRRHRTGHATELDLLQVGQNVDRTMQAERGAEHDLHLARLRLRQATGIAGEVELVAAALSDRAGVDNGEDLDHTEGVKHAESPPVPVELDAEWALATAMEHRLEVSAAEQELARRAREVRLADNDYTPKAQLERAKIARAQAELELAGARARVRSDVWSALFALKEARGRLRLARGDLALAVADLDVIERRYANGQRALDDLLDAEARLASAESDTASTTYNVRVARARYLRSIGMAFERWPGLLQGATRKDDGV